MKKQITLVLALLVLLLLSPAAFAQGTGDLGTRSVVDSGTCGAQGDNLTWVLYDDGELVISGSGDMADYHPSEGNTPPWYSPSDPGIYWSLNAVEITSLAVEEGVSSLGKWAFRGCAALTDVSLPHSLREIRWGTFAHCNTLSTLILPEGLVMLNADSFANTSLREITFPASLRDCNGEGSSDATFSRTPLMNIYVAPDSPYFCSVDGVVFSKDLTTIVMFPVGRTGSYTVPDSVQSIGLKAFDEANLDTVVISDSVTSIDKFAFLGSKIQSCLIPNSVTNIGTDAFGNCRYLTRVTIPEGVASIGDSAFSGCDNLTEIQVAEGNSNYSSTDGCLYNKEQTTILCCPAGKSGSLIIPDSVSAVGDYVLYGCSKLTSLTIPNGVPTIGAYAFSGCRSLVSVTIPESVRAIVLGAFNGCNSLTDVYYAGLPAQWEAIDIMKGNDPLQQATIHYSAQPQASILDSGTCGAQGDNLTWVLYDDGELVISGSGDMADYQLSEGNAPPWYSPSSPGNYWSENVHVISSLVVEEGVTSLGGKAFQNCSSLTSVTLPDSITSIDTYTFSDCSGLSSVTIPNGVTEIGLGAFYNCCNLTSVTIPVSVTTIWRYSFNGCDNLTDVYYAGSSGQWKVIDISEEDNEPLQQATIHYSIQPQGKIVDSGTCGAQGDNLTWVLYDDGELVISGTGDMADYYGWKGNMPQWYTPSVSGRYVSDNAVEITSLTVEEGVTTLGAWAFCGCANLTDVSLPRSLREIRESTFANCKTLSKLILPKGLVTINSDSFRNTSLTEITFPASLQDCQGGGSDATFAHSPLMNIYVAPDSPYFCSVDGVVFSKDQTTIVMFPVGRTGSYTVPDSVQEIGFRAFGETNLDAIVLPDSVITVAESAFQFARIRSCTLPKSLTDIGRFAFAGCHSLTDITVPESVTSIDNSVFNLCGNLTEILVSEGNSNYSSIDGCLYNKDQTTILCCPAGKSGSFTVPDGVTTIGDGAFNNCSNLESVIIPNSVSSIGIAAFDYCRGLTSVSIPDSVTAIRWSAFEGCDNMTDVYYAGLPAQWNTINIEQGNEPMQQATIHYIPWPEAQTLVLPADLTEIGEEAFAGGAFTYVRLAEHTAAIGARAFAGCAQLQYIYIPAACTEIAADAFEGISDLTILGPADSAAQRFASAHGLRFLVS